MFHISPMLIPSHIQGLIFDCDGTLVDTPPLYTLAWISALRPFGAEPGPDWFRTRTGLSEHLLMDDVDTHFRTTLPRSDVIQLLREAFMANLHTLQEISAVTTIARQYQGLLKLAVASSGPAAIVNATLGTTGLATLFDDVVTIEDVTRPKPAPDLFLEAARRLGLPPDACLVFEDSTQGLEAARRAGMTAVDINLLPAPPSSGSPDHS